jgi:hypothetical protein
VLYRAVNEPASKRLVDFPFRNQPLFDKVGSETLEMSTSRSARSRIQSETWRGHEDVFEES